MNHSAAKLGLQEGGRSMKRWWSTDRRLRRANAHKIPKEDPSVSPSSPHYLSQTCSALVKRKSFKNKVIESPRATHAHLQEVTPTRSGVVGLEVNEGPVAVVVTNDFVDEGEAIFSPVKIADPLSGSGEDSVPNGGVMKSPRPPRARTLKAFSLLKSVPEDEGFLGFVDHTDSCSMDSGNSQSTWSSVKSQPQQRLATKSELILGHFKEFLGNIKRNRPKFVDDIPFTLEDLWYTGKLGDLVNLENMWTIAITPVEKETTLGLS